MITPCARRLRATPESFSGNDSRSAQSPARVYIGVASMMSLSRIGRPIAGPRCLPSARSLSAFLASSITSRVELRKHVQPRPRLAERRDARLIELHELDRSQLSLLPASSRVLRQSAVSRFSGGNGAAWAAGIVVKRPTAASTPSELKRARQQSTQGRSHHAVVLPWRISYVRRANSEHDQCQFARPAVELRQSPTTASLRPTPPSTYRRRYALTSPVLFEGPTVQDRDSCPVQVSR